MTNFDLTGVYPAMTTPFAPDGSIDHETLADDTRRLERAGVDGLVPVGSTGESATLTHDEHIEVVETVVEAAEDVPVIAGSGSNSTREALELSRRSADVGADGLLLISPYYNKPEQAGLIEHYQTIADEVDVPQIVYNVPSRTGSNIEPATVATLADHENIAGYKAASGDIGQISEVVERTREQEFAILSGDDALTLPVISVGGHGVISVTGNIEPERTAAMVHAALDGDFDSARELHHELGPLSRQLFIETNPIPVKAAMEIRGYAPGTLRPPLTELRDEHYEMLEATLEQLEATREASLGLEPAGGA
ncbi:dihydrodipicolinate synthase [Halogeometricum borinquense DSM 11551]|uniref:4-hydroxy-tetrahydrodipicolinate synthase n=1 Tax=Halogeometricum borinquense (strain ATCC 700274 / DSM 11551 / JCM 10706 / KCTC 4070 / PR3) TaxID=469382 RepID=E4NQH8_HALBP|nr:4-hydroxy-tetrahydrodipicolinate synthase [Halogeometricum borinquense]ADQ67851.1 dihydrodipicolinate synthase [Halogeometricum borinquense DSM 11551]ELY23467.1 dihydrodipicolinate synthase [Halogeometricum borinquense DSM 11551]